ncbi:MAG: hypothetical protein AAGF53_07765 [Pseudomonadota bacterium]
MSAFAFYAMAIVALMAALGAVLTSNVFVSVLLLSLTFLSIAGLVLWLDFALLSLAFVFVTLIGVPVVLWVFAQRYKLSITAVSSLPFAYAISALFFGALAFLQISIASASWSNYGTGTQTVAEGQLDQVVPSSFWATHLWLFVLLGLIALVVAVNVSLLMSKKNEAVPSGDFSLKMYRNRARNIAFTDTKAR